MGVPARVFTIGLAGCAALALASCDPSGNNSASGTSGASSSATGAANEPSASSLVSSMQSSVRSASSVHVSGLLSRNGVPLGVDLNVARNGDVAGTIRQHGIPLQVIATNGKIYIEATPAFLREVRVPAAACASACGKWIALTQGEASQLAGHFSMQNLVTPLASGQAPKLTSAGSTTVGGQPAWLLRAGDGSTVAVSSSGKHYPLRSSSGGSPHQVVTYSHWNTAPAPKAPPASQLLKLNGG
jgi:hypothetical protein